MHSRLFKSLAGWTATVAITGILLIGGCDTTEEQGSASVSHAGALPSPSPQPTARTGGEPDYLVDISAAPATLDVGYLAPNDQHRFLVRFHNDGSQPIQVLQATSDCSCMAPQVEGGGQGEDATDEVTVSFTAPARVGIYEKTLAIRFEGPPAFLAIKVNARVGLPLSAIPAQPTLVGDSRATGLITIMNDGPHPVRLLYAISGDERLSVLVPAEAVPPGGSAPLRLEAHHLAKGPLKTIVRIRTDVEHQRELRIQVRSEVSTVASTQH